MATLAPHTAHEDEHHGPLHHQFEDIEQQNETYIVGMWSFLVTEVMFFGALFLMYTLYRWNYQADFYRSHHALSILAGGFNTTILLFSSFTMVLAVQQAQLHKRKNVIALLGVTIVCAFIFLGVKFIYEWPEKAKHALVPGIGFGTKPEHLEGANKRAGELFYSLYFAMTGLHALHIIIGIILLGALAYFWKKGNRLVTNDYIPTEMIGLYWHFVDLVWIFLFPLFYLIPR